MQTTLQQLIDRASSAADMSDNFVTKAQWTHFANAENLALALFLARSGWTQNVETFTITVTGSEAGAFSVPPIGSPNTVLAIVAVHQIKNDRVRQIQLSNSIDFLRTLPSSTAVMGDPVFYRVLSSTSSDFLSLNFYPRPNTGDQFLVSYIVEPARLSDSVGVRYPMGWEERIVLGMARRALAKEESDTSEIKRQMSELDQQIEEACWNRVLGESPTVRNRDAAVRGWTETLSYPGPSEWWWPV